MIRNLFGENSHSNGGTDSTGETIQKEGADKTDNPEVKDSEMEQVEEGEKGGRKKICLKISNR